MKKIILTLTVVLNFCLNAHAQITGMTPNQGNVGQPVLSTTVTSNGLFMTTITPSGNINQIFLYQGSTQIVLCNAVTFPNNALVTHPDTVKNINFNIPPTAPTGLYNLVVKTQNGSGVVVSHDTLFSAFSVLPPDGYLQGNIYEDINSNRVRDPNEHGILGQPVSIQPGSHYFYTDSLGNFSVPVMNGTHTVQVGYNGSSGLLYLTTDSSAYHIVMNGANITNLDFGMHRKLTALAPTQSIAGRTLNFTLTSEPLFGTVSFITFRSTNYSFYVYQSAAIQTIDSNTVNFTINIPPGATPGVYDLEVSISGQGYSHELSGCFTVLPYDSYLQGKIYFDVNSNGVFDVSEPLLPYERVNIYPDSGAGFSNNIGDYSIGVLNGNHTVAWVPSSTSIFQLSSDSASYTRTNTGTLTGLDFGLETTNPDYTCEMNLYSGFPRCNSAVYSYMYFENRSNNPFNGILYLVKDPSTTYISAYQTPSGISGDTIFWNVFNLQPFGLNYIGVRLGMPLSGNIQLTAGIISLDGSGGPQLTDVSTVNQTVRCSYDPNDKSVLPEGIGPDHQTQIGDWLEYFIRFQNTGTDTAINVTIHDFLSGDLDLSTFEMIGSSHSVSTEIKQDGEAVFTFANIMLPDSNVDEPNSHGFLKYRIRSKGSTIEQTKIENTAFIIFDANAPIVTNTTDNLMVNILPVGIQDFVKANGKSTVYPNPFSTMATLLFNNPNHKVVHIDIRDILGNLVRSYKMNGEEQQIRKENLKAGVYIYHLIFDDTQLNLTGKFVVE